MSNRAGHFLLRVSCAKHGNRCHHDCLSVYTECIVAKRCVLEQKLLLTDKYKLVKIGSSIGEIDWCQNEWPWPLFRGRVKVIALHSTLNIPETVRDGGLVSFKGPPIGSGIWSNKWSLDRWRHVALIGQTRDPNALRAQYLENRCYLAIIANYCSLSSTVGYPSDSLA